MDQTEKMLGIVCGLILSALIAWAAYEVFQFYSAGNAVLALAY